MQLSLQSGKVREFIIPLVSMDFSSKTWNPLKSSLFPFWSGSWLPEWLKYHYVYKAILPGDAQGALFHLKAIKVLFSALFHRNPIKYKLFCIYTENVPPAPPVAGLSYKSNGISSIFGGNFRSKVEKWENPWFTLISMNFSSKTWNPLKF